MGDFHIFLLLLHCRNSHNLYKKKKLWKDLVFSSSEFFFEIIDICLYVIPYTTKKAYRNKYAICHIKNCNNLLTQVSITATNADKVKTK